MAFTQIQIDALKAALSSGTLKVRMNDREVTYRSLQEMRELLAIMEAEVNPTTTGQRPRGYALVPDRE